MSDDKNRDVNLPGPSGRAEEINAPGIQKKDTAEIKLREIPGLADLEASREFGKGNKSPATFFTLILVILFGFTVIVYFIDKYRDESYLAVDIEEKTAVTGTTGSPGVDASTAAQPASGIPTVEPAAGRQTPLPQEGSKKYVLAKVKTTNPEKGVVNVSRRVPTSGNILIAKDLLISRQKVGPVELDMTIQRMQSVFPDNYGFVKKRIEYNNEFYGIIKVIDDKGSPLFFVNEKNNKVWGIQIISSKYKTGKGIGVGSTLGSLKIYYPEPSIWATKNSAPLVSVEGLAGVFILQNEGIDFGKQIFPDHVKIDSILIGGSPFLN